LSCSLEENIRRTEREYLVRIFAECEGVKTRVAERARISHQTVYNKLAELHQWLQELPEDKRVEETARLRTVAGDAWQMLLH
jgi:DNA-binding NtrC family response regulator